MCSNTGRRGIRIAIIKTRDPWIPECLWVSDQFQSNKFHFGVNIGCWQEVPWIVAVWTILLNIVNMLLLWALFLPSNKQIFFQANTQPPNSGISTSCCQESLLCWWDCDTVQLFTLMASSWSDDRRLQLLKEKHVRNVMTWYDLWWSEVFFICCCSFIKLELYCQWVREA